MPQTEFGKVNIKIAASAGELNATLNQTEARLKSFAATAQSAVGGGGGLLGGFGSFGLAVAGIQAAVGAAKELYRWMVDTGKAADDLNDAAENLGATSSGLYALRAAAIGVGEGLDKSLEHLSRFIGQALNGNEEAQASFTRLGLSVEKLSRVPLDKAALTVNDAIKALGSSAQQNAAAFEVYGRSGQKLLELIRRGSGFTEEMRKFALERGALPTNALLQGIDDLQVATSKLEISWQGFKNAVEGTKIPQAFVSGLQGAADFFTLYINAIKNSSFAPGPEVAENRIKELQQAKDAQTKKFNEDNSKVLKTANELTQQFHAQLVTLGLGANEARAMETALKNQGNPSREVQNAMRALVQDARDLDATLAGKKLFDETLPPLEKADIELRKMVDLLMRGKITMDLLGRGAEKVADELIKAADIQQKAALPAPDALLRGSQAERSFLIDLQRKAPAEVGDKAERFEKAIEKLKDLEREGNGDRKRIIDLLRDKFNIVPARF